MSSTETVVVVDDDREVRTLIELALASPGRKIVGFSEADAALVFLRGAERIDLVVSDIAMEGCDGSQMLRQLRSNERTMPTPLILVTASDPADDPIAGPNEAGVEQLRTPFEISDLRQRVDSALRRSSGSAAASDPLTGLLARTQFESALASRLGESAAAGNSLTVVLCGVDGLEQLDKRFGSAQRDAVLRRLAAIVTMHLRATDAAARIGDHDFATLHAACDAAGASAIAERIVGAVSCDPQCIGLRISLGVVVAAPNANCDVASLLAAADECLRAAKLDDSRICVKTL
jgi:two-component system cell cycle response regulator